MIKIMTSRLLEYIPSSVEWGEHVVTLEDIKEGLKNNLPRINEVFATRSGFVQDFKTKEWHVGRILYFVDNPEKIDAMSIDNHCANGFVLPFPAIVDGHHRLLANLFLQKEYIDIEYGGREDVLSYLKGEIAEMPE